MRNVKNHAILVEGFEPEFYARGRFMKYSMSGQVGSRKGKKEKMAELDWEQYELDNDSDPNTIQINRKKL